MRAIFGTSARFSGGGFSVKGILGFFGDGDVWRCTRGTAVGRPLVDAMVWRTGGDVARAWQRRPLTFRAGGYNSNNEDAGGCEAVVPLRPWECKMSDDEFGLMSSLLSAPTPVGFEEAMVKLVQDSLADNIPASWKWHRFKGHAGAVLDTDPSGGGDKPSVMIVGHSDKIRLQVRKIGSDGKVWVNSDSHLPLTLLGNEVVVFSEREDAPGKFRTLRGATVEALGAIHFAEAGLRTGSKGIKPEQIYLEFGLHGEKLAEQVEALGVRVGDNVLMDRPIKKGVSARSFQGAYLDNGLGCFVVAQVARMLASPDAASVLDDVRMLFTLATHEEIGRFGSRVLVRHFSPDILIAVDVNHDYNAAPGVLSKNYPNITMGKGPTLSLGSVTAPYLNSIIQRAAQRAGIPLQLDVVGRDTGTDAMAAVLSATDCASTSVGIPIRNMHTISEMGVTDDVIACYHLVVETVSEIAAGSRNGKLVMHPDLSLAEEMPPIPNNDDK